MATSNRWPEGQKARDVAVLCARICDQKKAKDVVVLNVGKTLVITDFFVIATGLNRRHVQALAADVEKEMKNLSIPKISVEGLATGTWVLLDYGGFVVHLFQPEQREYYDLDHLWEDAPRVRFEAEKSASPAAGGRSASTSAD